MNLHLQHEKGALILELIGAFNSNAHLPFHQPFIWINVARAVSVHRFRWK